uniref:E3 ubiquitin-protein ligase NEURL3 n=1 Tax=Bos indicus x Bos taurus TaxID=30522 RepID=A0A4W2FZJ0_BOBOX
MPEEPRRMGAQICSQADAESPREALRFHAQAVGAQVRLDAERSTAYRRATFHDGIVFSQRPVRLGERVALRLLWHEHGWLGGLRVGFTRLDPARVSAPSLPPFLCPDLEQQSQTWAAMLPDGRASPGDVVRFWVNRRGQIFAQVNSGPQRRLREGVLMGAPLWAVMDLYGTTKAIELLDPTANGFPTTTPRGLSDEALPGPKGENLAFSPLLQRQVVPSVTSAMLWPPLSHFLKAPDFCTASPGIPSVGKFNNALATWVLHRKSGFQSLTVRTLSPMGLNTGI